MTIALIKTFWKKMTQFLGPLQNCRARYEYLLLASLAHQENIVVIVSLHPLDSRHLCRREEEVSVFRLS